MNEARRVWQTIFRDSDSEDTIGRLRGTVDGFNQGDATPAFGAVASAGPLILDGCEKIFEHGLVPAKIADRGRRRTLVFVGSSGFDNWGRSVSKIYRDNAIVFENDGAFSAGDFDPARVARIRGGGGMKNTQGAAGKFERRDSSILGFNFVEQRGSACLHANNIAEQPKQQIDSMNALIDQRTAAVESQRAAPLRIGVVLGRAIPLHASVYE